MQPPLKRLSTGTGQQEGQRMQDVDENFGRVEQAIDTLNANASLLKAYKITNPVANGFTTFSTSQLGVTNLNNYAWFVTMLYKSGWVTAASYTVYNPTASSTRLMVYLRTETGTAPPPGDYTFYLLRVPL